MVKTIEIKLGSTYITDYRNGYRIEDIFTDGVDKVNLRINKGVSDLFPGEITDLQGWWKLNGNAEDSSGNGNDGTWYGTESYDTGLISGTQTSDFDGSSYIDTNSNFLDNLGAFSIICWVNFDSTSAQRIIQSETNDHFYISVNGSQQLDFFINGLSDSYLSSGFTISTNTWYHIQIIYDGSTKYIYINNNLEASESATGTTDIANNILFGVNSTITTGYFDGRLTDVRFYPRALSTNERTIIYNRGFGNVSNGETLFTKYQSLEIYEGYSGTANIRRFKGLVIKKNEDVQHWNVVAYSNKYKAVLANLRKHYKITGTEGGKISEIFKDLMDNAGLSYDSSTIQDSGTTILLTDFLVKGTDIAERADALADRINWQWRYESSSDKVYFEPRGFRTNTSTIFAGGTNNNIVNKQLVWKDDDTSVVNEVNVEGAFDRVVEPTQLESGTGAQTEFTLNFIPDSIEVTVDGIEQTIGKKNVLETGVDVVLDSANQLLTFQPGSIPPSGTNNIAIKITRLIETPVTVRDEESITEANNVISSTTITLSDVVSIDDAELIGQNYIDRRKGGFSSTILLMKPSLVEDLNLEVGQLIPFQSVFNPNRNNTYLITKLVRSDPETHIEVHIGNKEFKLFDTDFDSLMRLKRLEERFKSEDILLNIIRKLTNTLDITNSLTIVKENINDTFTLDHPVNSLLDQGQILDLLNTSSSNWTGSGFSLSDNSDSDFVIVQTGSLKADWVASGSGTISSTQVLGDLSTETGTASGTPTQGTFGIWVYVTNSTDITSMSLKIGSSASDYIETTGVEFGSSETYSDETFTLRDGWNYIVFRNNNGSVIGTPDWTNVDFTELTIVKATSSGTLYLDYFTISKSDSIGLNGLGLRYTTNETITS